MPQDSRESQSPVATPWQRDPSEPPLPLTTQSDATPSVTPESDHPRAWPAVWQWLDTNTFVPHAVPARWRHPATGYILVVLLQVAAAILTRLLIESFGSYSFPGIVELLVVALMALSWGAGPALFATLLGVALEEVAVLPVQQGERQFTAGDLVEIALFLTAGISISLVASAMTHSRRRAIQERAAAQARELSAMQQAQERMDEFLAIASHDLRTPVTATVGFVEIADRRCERLAAAARSEQSDLVRQIDAVQTCVREAGQSVERLARLVNLLFDTSLVRSGKLEIHPTVCDLRALVRDQVEAVRVSAPKRVIRLHIRDKEPVWVVADADRLGQVVTNYLTNALKYSPTNQAIDVRVTVADAWARVAVEDRGPGLPPSELERIWQPFQRVAGNPVQGAASSGLGMGLHISRTIIEQHRGQVGVESVEGHGATFWFMLPVA